MATTDQYTVMGDITKTRNAVRFLGGDVDDYIQVDAFAVARTAANDTKGTWTAWIMVPDLTSTGTILSVSDANVVEFIEFNVAAGKLQALCTDATTAQFVSATDDICLKPHTWHHVALVQAADGSGPKFYVDGVKFASTNSTATDVNEWFNNLDGVDQGQIGTAQSAGDGSFAKEFTGYISDVKVYTTALSAAQVVDDYRGKANVTGTAADLHNHWDMDGDYIDAGSGADNGTAVGAILLVQANEFTSRLTFSTGVPLVADKVQIAMNDRIGLAYVIQAA